MKKLSLFVLGICFSVACFSQSLAQPVLGEYVTPQKVHAGTRLLLDTLDMYMQRATAFALFLNPYGGYVYGTGLVDIGNGPELISEETACHYDGIGNATVVEAFCFAKRKYINGNADSVQFRIYEVNSDTVPTAMTGSASVSMADFDTSNQATAVILNAPISTSFLVALNYAGNDDTLGLVSSNPNTHDGNGENRARYKLTPSIAALIGSTYFSINEFWSNQVDCDVLIVPIVDIQTGMDEFKNDQFTLKPLSPNPSTGMVTLEYHLLQPARISYQVMDATGKVVIASQPKEQATSAWKEVIDMTSFSAGKYYVTFNAGKKSLTQRMMLVK